MRRPFSWVEKKKRKPSEMVHSPYGTTESSLSIEGFSLNRLATNIGDTLYI
jgi:hypothetical protein